jgi:cobalt-zinc-cadmium efflux system membrane fusion protein
MNTFFQRHFRLIVGIGLLLGGAVVAVVFVPPVRNYAEHWFTGKANADTSSARKPVPAELLPLKNGELGLRLSKEAIASLDLQPHEVETAVKTRALPPLIGTVNYDNDRMFIIRPRFAGAIEEIKQVPDSEYPQGEKKLRPIRWGDSVKQGETLAILWSRDLGEKKAALVDAICALDLSSRQKEEQKKAVEKGAFPLVTYLATVRQVQADRGALLTAERTLRMWKLPEAEIQEIRNEAKFIIDLKKERTPEEEKNWARAEIPVPHFMKDASRQLVIVEKNAQLGELADPARDMPLFKLADLSRLQIWVHPPEEYLPVLRDKLKEGPGALKWDIRFQSESAQTTALQQLPVTRVSLSLEPNQHTPMLTGYLDNPDGKYLIGQFVTATIYVPPPPHTVEVPTDAINHLNGQELVFVQNPKAKDEFLLRRVSVVQSYKQMSLVRSKLTPEEEKLAESQKSKGEFPVLQALQPGEHVITRGVVELTAALEELRNTSNPSK